MVLTPQQGPNDAPPSTPPPLELGMVAPVSPPDTNKRKEKVLGRNGQESEDVTTKGGGVYKQLMKANAESNNSDLEDVTVKGGTNYRRPSATLESNPQDPPPQTPQLGKEPSNQKPHPMDARRGSFIAQRITNSGDQRGPWCLFSGENGTSLGEQIFSRFCFLIVLSNTSSQLSREVWEMPTPPGAASQPQR